MSGPEPRHDASVAIVNARIFTADPRRPWADAVLVIGGRISLLGSSAEVRKRAGAAIPVVDARGGMVLPSGLGARREEAFTDEAARYQDGGAPLRMGEPASFVLLDRDLSARRAAPEPAAVVVIAISDGRVTHDPGGLLLP